MSLLGVSLGRPKRCILLSAYSLLRYVILSDIAGKSWLQKKDKMAELWSNLHYQYSLNGAPTSPPMVQGSFVDQ